MTNERVAYQREYHMRNRERALKSMRQWRSRNPDYMRNYRERNRDRILANNREWKQRNHDRVRELKRRSNERNRDTKRRWDERNHDYVINQRLQHRSKLAHIPAPRRNTTWTHTEDAIAVRRDIGLVEIAYILGRSYDAVSMRRKKIRRLADSTPTPPIQLAQPESD